jgi:hypothetical protein
VFAHTLDDDASTQLGREVLTLSHIHSFTFCVVRPCACRFLHVGEENRDSVQFATFFSDSCDEFSYLVFFFCMPSPNVFCVSQSHIVCIRTYIDRSGRPSAVITIYPVDIREKRALGAFR